MNDYDLYKDKGLDHYIGKNQNTSTDIYWSKRKDRKPCKRHTQHQRRQYIKECIDFSVKNDDDPGKMVSFTCEQKRKIPFDYHNQKVFSYMFKMI
jgi:hypothetical protein